VTSERIAFAVPENSRRGPLGPRRFFVPSQTRSTASNVTSFAKTGRVMGLVDLLHPRRVHIVPAESVPLSKKVCLEVLADVVAETTPLPRSEVHRVLVEREELQSTGLGESVAIPHGALEGLENQVAAIILSRPPVDFDAIDGRPVHIVVAVLSPKRAAGEHLKTLARISRLLRTESFRARLLQCASGEDALRCLADEEGHVKP